MESFGFLSLVLECLVISSASNNNNNHNNDEDKNNSRFPCGPRMCERLCRDTAMCFSFLYSSLFLSCILEARDDKPLHDSFKNFTLTKEKTNLSCTNRGRTFFSRKKILQCPVYKRKRSTTGEVHGQRENAQLLVFRGAVTEDIRQIFLNNFSVNLLGQFEHVASIMYVASTRKFFISFMQTGLYIVDNFDRMPSSSEKIDTHVRCMTVADKIIFYVKLSGRESILWNMTLQGKTKKQITKLSKTYKSIHADVKRSVLYLNTRQGIIGKINYRGYESRKFHVKPCAMCLAQGGAFAYLSEFNSDQIYKYSLSNQRKKPLFKLNSSRPISSPINFISLLGKELFLVTRDCDVLYVGPKGSGEIRMDKPSGSGYCSGVLKV